MGKRGPSVNKGPRTHRMRRRAPARPPSRKRVGLYGRATPHRIPRLDRCQTAPGPRPPPWCSPVWRRSSPRSARQRRRCAGRPTAGRAGWPPCRRRRRARIAASWNGCAPSACSIPPAARAAFSACPCRWSCAWTVAAEAALPRRGPLASSACAQARPARGFACSASDVHGIGSGSPSGRAAARVGRWPAQATMASSLA